MIYVDRQLSIDIAM